MTKFARAKPARTDREFGHGEAAADPLAALRADLAAAARAIAEGTTTSAALVVSCLERAAAVEARVHAFAWLEEARVRGLAAAADAAPRGGLLRGVPVAVKDIIDTAGVPTEFGSPIFAGRVPTSSADVVRALEDAGAVVFGKTVTAELAYFHPGPTRNPYELSRTPGGSSMGSAAVVAAGVVPAAVGTQTNGSVIRPAAFCGVVGFKPSFGRISRDGIMPFAPTLDQVGVFARTVESAALLVAALVRGAAEAWRPGPPRRAPRFAVVRTSDWERAEPGARARFDADTRALAAAGAELAEPPLPTGLDAEALATLRAIMAFEANVSFASLLAEHGARVSQTLRALVDEGAHTPRPTYEAALEERQRLVDAFATWLQPFDALLTPPALGEAPDRATTGDPRFCTRWTLVGAPALTLPTGLGPHGLPLGLQVVGAPGADERLVAVAAWAERYLPAPRGPSL